MKYFITLNIRLQILLSNIILLLFLADGVQINNYVYKSMTN